MARSARLPLSVQISGSQPVFALLQWFDAHGRRFHWRDVQHTPDAYLVFVSEIMLQQTGTARVSDKLPAFLAKFPTVEALANAPVASVLQAWQGMGYYRRALNMQRAARVVCQLYGGVFPDSYHDLKALPGVGDYTASAILCFAFGRDVPVVDVNVSRVLSRLFFRCYAPHDTMPSDIIRLVDRELLPVGNAAKWHHALMDLGAMVCIAIAPDCRHCPLQKGCLSGGRFVTGLYHKKSARKPEPHLRNVPRRLWRGKVLQLLRNTHDGMIAGQVAADVLQTHTIAEKRWLLDLIGVMAGESLIQVLSTGVAEGSVQDSDVIRLPL